MSPQEPSETTALAPDELLGLKARHITHRGELNELESQNIVEGLTWLDRRPKSFDVLTNDAARAVHRRLFGKVWDWAGVYRLTEKNIGVPVWQVSTEMRTCLGDARCWRENGTFDPIEAAARFHHKLVWVHPFANGNGRWARIMADTYIAGIDPDIFLDWSGGGTLAAENDHRARYIAALRSADEHELGPLVEFVMEIAN
ncbi:MAG: mobile mystery protein B [Boseongicola sp. SB0662_bin_57]|nr:mobile mystery protein B [Boseongicola sp. SB0662_bin_57]